MNIKLAIPRTESSFSLEQSLAQRRSVRRFTPQPLSLDEVSQLLWAVQGITHAAGYRTAPSAGALYPLETYLAAGTVVDLSPGLYHYHPREHLLVPVRETDIRSELADAALGQQSIAHAPAALILTAVFARTTAKYGERGIRYVYLDAGHAAENFCLQATALGLGTVPIGAFSDDKVAAVLHLQDNEHPLYILPAGKI